jgi:hypothetical protein
LTVCCNHASFVVHARRCAPTATIDIGFRAVLHLVDGRCLTKLGSSVARIGSAVRAICTRLPDWAAWRLRVRAATINASLIKVLGLIIVRCNLTNLANTDHALAVLVDKTASFHPTSWSRIATTVNVSFGAVTLAVGDARFALASFTSL